MFDVPLVKNFFKLLTRERIGLIPCPCDPALRAFSPRLALT